MFKVCMIVHLYKGLITEIVIYFVLPWQPQCACGYVYKGSYRIATKLFFKLL